MMYVWHTARIVCLQYAHTLWWVRSTHSLVDLVLLHHGHLANVCEKNIFIRLLMMLLGQQNYLKTTKKHAD